MDFAQPKDYKEMPPPTLKKSDSLLKREEQKANEESYKILSEKYKRIDGKKLTEKQLRAFHEKEKEK